MTKFLITALVILGLSMGGYQIYQFWGKYRGSDTSSQAAPPPPEVNGDSLAGMPQDLEPTYQASRQRGVTGLHDFLTEYGNRLSDPRLGWIQLDYVVLVAPGNPAEARRVFGLVKGRTQPDSPVYSRVQQLEKTYE